MRHPIKLKVNGRSVRRTVEAQETLLDFLRERMSLTGTKEGCGQGDCGACTVLIDGKPANACLVLASEAAGKEITTIEGLSMDGVLHPLQQAFVDSNAVQCGFCTPGMILTAHALLNENPDPSPEEIRRYMAGNLCRCTGYAKIVEAVQSAAARSGRMKGSPKAGEKKRQEAPEKTTGNALFTGDMKRPGMLIGKFLRSSIPHARIRSIDTSAALSLPGVVTVITAADFPDKRIGFIVHDEYIMAKDKVRHIGETLAAVAAVDEETAERALGLISVDMEELPPVFTISESIKADAPLIHENYREYTSEFPLTPKGNACLDGWIRKGDVEKGFAESDEIFEDRYTMPVVHQTPMEPKAVLAEMDHNGRLHVWTGTARPFAVQSGIAEILDIPMSHIRVTGTRMGGHFGSKGEMTFEPIVAMLALKAKKPVKVEMTRQEEFISGNPRHAMEISIKTGVKRDGTLLARQARISSDTGAYAYFGPLATTTAMNLVSGPYNIPNVFVEGLCVYTNKLSCGPCRGPGAPQALLAGEAQLDRIARKLGIDPIELRRKNALKANDSTAAGQVLTEGGYDEALLVLKEYLEAHRGLVPQGDEKKAFGIGLAGGFWGMGGAGSSATVRVNEDGTVVLLMGAVETGAGSDTAMSLLVAEALGISPERVKVVSGDTDTCPFDFGAIGSRTTQAMGSAVHIAVEGVKRQLLAFAENHLKTPKENLAFAEGRIYVKGRSEQGLAMAKAAHLLTVSKGGPVVATGTNTNPSPPFDPDGVEGIVRPNRPFYAFGAQAALVQVDRTTGKIDVLKVIAAHNVGKAVFKAGVEGQIQGGVAMGLGYALSEEAIFSEGRLVNDSFVDYRVPTMMDVPEIVSIIVEKEDAKSPEDIRGIGEPATIPTAAAVVNAVYDAIGVRINDLPLTPEKVYRAMHGK
jgi:CO/xanthine dehydrogenase Mo-binding subunit/aerobic-type carbon monoxide dehydrogenase small subunit (CoxS/CutS family)